MPKSFEEVKYSLCRVDFNPDSRAFGQVVDTLYNAADGGKSVSFPRVSPDGKYLLYTLAAFGNFSIWHADADLHMINLQTGIHDSLTLVNSPEVDSYHSWSSNSRWFVFSSRRMDGLYTRPYISYIDANGKACKPFLLPQKDTDFYLQFMKSYNIPEFVTGKVKKQSRAIALKAKNEKGTDVKFAE
jgi:dipeptidyl aminopeptidase/acylaminoacyl peptidase